MPETLAFFFLPPKKINQNISYSSELYALPLNLFYVENSVLSLLSCVKDELARLWPVGGMGKEVGKEKGESFAVKWNSNGFLGFFSPLYGHEYNKLYIINHKGLVIQVVKNMYTCILDPTKKKVFHTFVPQSLL